MSGRAEASKTPKKQTSHAPLLHCGLEEKPHGDAGLIFAEGGKKSRLHLKNETGRGCRLVFMDDNNFSRPAREQRLY